MAYVFILIAILHHTFICRFHILHQNILMDFWAYIFILILLVELFLWLLCDIWVDFCFFACWQILASASLVKLFLKSQVLGSLCNFSLLFRYFTKSDSVDQHICCAFTSFKDCLTVLFNQKWVSGPIQKLLFFLEQALTWVELCCWVVQFCYYVFDCSFPARLLQRMFPALPSLLQWLVLWIWCLLWFSESLLDLFELGPTRNSGDS